MERTRVGVRSGCGARSCAALTPTFARAEVQATISDVLADPPQLLQLALQTLATARSTASR